MIGYNLGVVILGLSIMGIILFAEVFYRRDQ
jgi:hypothetical protein